MHGARGAGEPRGIAKLRVGNLDPDNLRGTQGGPKEGGLNIGQHEGLNVKIFE